MDVTIQALSRLTYLPDRDAEDNGNLIAAQNYWDVYFTGGEISNVALDNVIITNTTFSNTGLRIEDPDGSHYLTISPGSNLSANRTFTLTTGDADRTLTMAGNATISGTNTGDQTTAGTVDRITVTNGTTNPVIDIAATYVGQNTITTLGTITTGTWNGSTVGVAYGGTGATTLTSNAVLKGNGTGAITASGVSIDGSNNVTGVVGLTATGTVTTDTIQTSGASGVVVKNSGGTTAMTVGASNNTDVSIAGALTLGTDLSVANGGTGLSSATAYAVLCGGTTSTGEFQSIASVGTAGQVLTSNGPGALPTMQNPAGGGWVPIVTQTASNSTSIDFVNGSGGVVLDGTYKAYAVVISDAIPQTDGVSLLFRTSTDAGSTYDSGASDYSYSGTGRYANATGIDIESAGATSVNTTVVVENTTANGGLSGLFYLFGAGNASSYTSVTFYLRMAHIANGTAFLDGSGARLSAADVDAIRFIMSSGNITSGTFTLYGLASA